MSFPPCNGIFTSKDAEITTPVSSFRLFDLLPAELRIKIWLQTLERQRILKVRLRNRVLMDGLLARQGDERPEERKDERYGAVVDGFQTISRLFRVSRESRDAALAFYRVCLPCWLIRGASRDAAMQPGFLYFNPEYDFLYISNDTGQVVDFLHDLKTVHDPRKLGLLNLAVDRNGLTGGGGLCTIDLASLSPPHEKSFVETLTQLHEVFFVQVQATGRHVFGLRSGAVTPEQQMNLSFPIAAMALNFNRLPQDPRPIAHDLSRVFVNSDPRSMLYAWGRFFYASFGGSIIPETEYRILLTFSPTARNLYDRQDAQEWLQREQDTWAQETSWGGQFGSVRREDLQVTVPSAFGFWLFPVEAFGVLPANPTLVFQPDGPRTLDLTEHWPELALLDLH
ncbi:hypothetical protein GQ53DRAFT_837920 [Thozetella sp. PMI_491]|nr:hypothetical protein GQ53DRAFT_837920 [Thozetella sp. PMI_491]